jgi:hypothetical protein
MQRTRNKNKGFEVGHYARSEEELYKKAIELLDKCRVTSAGSKPEVRATH